MSSDTNPMHKAWDAYMEEAGAQKERRRPKNEAKLAYLRKQVESCFRFESAAAILKFLLERLASDERHYVEIARGPVKGERERSEAVGAANAIRSAAVDIELIGLLISEAKPLIGGYLGHPGA